VVLLLATEIHCNGVSRDSVRSSTGIIKQKQVPPRLQSFGVSTGDSVRTLPFKSTGDSVPDTHGHTQVLLP
jgi:hypothetical protein